jgi:hypothetical protein
MYLSAVLAVHVAAVAVAVHEINAAAAYWSHFLEGLPFPTLFTYVLALAPWLPWLSVAVVLAGIFVVWKTSESSAMHCLACVVAITIGILCVVAVGLSQPMSVAARVMDQMSANKSIERIP